MVSVAEWKEAEWSQQVPNVHTQPLLPRQWGRVIRATPWAVLAARRSQVALPVSFLALLCWRLTCGLQYVALRSPFKEASCFLGASCPGSADEVAVFWGGDFPVGVFWKHLW